MSRLAGRKFVLLDPDEPMVGICQVCKTQVTTVRSKTFKDAKTPTSAMLGLWYEMPYVECQVCKARSKKLIDKAGTKKVAVGTKVYVGVVPKPV